LALGQKKASFHNSISRGSLSLSLSLFVRSYGALRDLILPGWRDAKKHRGSAGKLRRENGVHESQMDGRDGHAILQGSDHLGTTQSLTRSEMKGLRKE
jgi:hypothetical protein